MLDKPKEYRKPYLVIKGGSVGELEDRVAEVMDKGYSPCGGVFFRTADGFTGDWCQGVALLPPPLIQGNGQYTDQQRTDIALFRKHSVGAGP